MHAYIYAFMSHLSNLFKEIPVMQTSEGCTFLHQAQHEPNTKSRLDLTGFGICKSQM